MVLGRRTRSTYAHKVDLTQVSLEPSQRKEEVRDVAKMYVPAEDELELKLKKGVSKSAQLPRPRIAESRDAIRKEG